jgi:hypothetical protein
MVEIKIKEVTFNKLKIKDLKPVKPLYERPESFEEVCKLMSIKIKQTK